MSEAHQPTGSVVDLAFFREVQRRYFILAAVAAARGPNREEPDVGSPT